MRGDGEEGFWDESGEGEGEGREEGGAVTSDQ